MITSDRNRYIAAHTTAVVWEALLERARKTGLSRSELIHRLLAKALRVSAEVTTNQEESRLTG